MVLGEAVADGGEHVADEEAVDAAAQAAAGCGGGKAAATAGKAEDEAGEYEAEEGGCAHNFLLTYQGDVLQRGAGDGNKDVDRYRHGSCRAALARKLQTLAHGLAHADDAAAAYLQPHLAGEGYGTQLVGMAMSGA